MKEFLLRVAVLCLLLPVQAAAQQKPTDRRAPVSSDEEFVALAKELPGFGGFFFDEAGRVNVVLRDPSQKALFEDGLVDGFDKLSARGAVRVVAGRYGFDELAAWRNDLFDLLAHPSVVYLDVDERRNRVVVGIDRTEVGRKSATRAGLKRSIAARQVPREAVTFVETDPVRPAATLRDSFRPLPGGVRIQSDPPGLGGSICTMGFNAKRSGVQGFVINSHCTSSYLAPDSTVIYQRSSSLSSDRVGQAIVDPAGYVCYPGWQCRFSDAAFVDYDSNSTDDFGRIARPTCVNCSSVSVGSSTFRITGTLNRVYVGWQLNKVGQTTGWTRGSVSQTCVHFSIQPGQAVLCQDMVDAGVNGGDSGAPVFSRTAGSSSVLLAGILWGESGGGFVMSSMGNIEWELGDLSVGGLPVGIP
ncbi:MAG: S1 family peptidase [Thermoanaerobaculia bacterium]|nr:S1 family peptidase [Thermoanaerobaculia bacterium]